MPPLPAIGCFSGERSVSRIPAFRAGRFERRLGLLFAALFLHFALPRQAAAQSACPPAPDYGYYHLVMDSARAPITSQSFWVDFFDGIRRIDSPFYASVESSSDVQPLSIVASDLKDYRPGDGWDVLSHHFGFYVDGSGGANISHPHFILYNKYDGVLRYFVNIGYRVQPNELLGVTLHFRELGSRYDWTESALLSHYDARMNAVDNFEKGVVLHSLVGTMGYFVGDWYFADFPMAYDPCTCSEETELHFRVHLVKEAEIYKTGFGGTWVLADSKNLNQDPGNKAVLNAAGAGFSGGVETNCRPNRNIDKTNLYGGGFAANHRLADSPEQEEIHQNEILDGLAKVEKGVRIQDEVNPNACDPFGFLVTGGRRSRVEPVMSLGRMQIAYSGFAQFETYYQSLSVVNPNAAHADTTKRAWANLPKPKHTLGVCNLLETPVLEYAEIANVPSWENPPFPDQRFAGYDYTDLRQFKVRDPLTFVVNPATGLEVVELNAAVVLEYGPGQKLDPLHPSAGALPVEYLELTMEERESRTGFFERMARAGFEVEAWPKAYPVNDTFTISAEDGPVILRTPYYKATCFDEISFLLHHPAESSKSLYDLEAYKPAAFPEIYCKLQARLRRADSLADDSTKDVLYLATYRTKQEDRNDAVREACGGCRYFAGAAPKPASSNPFGGGDYALRYFWRDTTGGAFPAYQDRAALDAPWPLPGRAHFPGYRQTLRLDAEALAADGVFYARDTLYVSRAAALASPAAEIRAYAGKAVVLESADGTETLKTGRDTLGPVLLAVGAPPAFDGCRAEPFDSAMATEAEVVSFCRSERYNPSAENATEEPGATSYAEFRARAYPNPFREWTILALELPAAGAVNVELFDLQGRAVAAPVRGKELPGGPAELYLSGDRLAAGVYFCRLTAAGETQILRLVKY